ncbi:MAG TPA: hypothetical protein VKA37_07915 [Halobacteriales archaeon]|nr:hypothetical protein [Halobacteriales archaeon]
MGTHTASRNPTASVGRVLVAGALSGLVGGVGMGVVLHAGSNAMPLIGALYGWPSVVGGWTAHLVNSVAIGVVFAALVTRPVLRRQTDTVVGSVTLGITFGAGVGLVTGGVMLPVSLDVIGTRVFPETLLPLPDALGGFVAILSIGVAHLVYGLLLGATFGYVYDRARA